MSGPNTEYDPVEVTPLKADEVEAMREAALAAIAGCRRPRGAQAGPPRPRRRPLAAGARQPRDRRAAAAGPQGRRPARRAGPRRGQQGARPSASAELEAEHEERMLVEETVDVTLPTDRRPSRRPAPDHDLRPSGSPTSSSPWAGRSPRDRSVEAEWLNFDALNLGPDHPARTMQDTFWTRARRRRARAAHPHLARCRRARC